MERDEYVARVRAAYDALNAGRFDAALSTMDDDVVLHIAGDHPLSGTYRGRRGLGEYLHRLQGATEAPGVYRVVSVLVDESSGDVLVEGTAHHGGEEPFVRTIVHQLRFDEGRIVEVWERPFDQAAENRFWRRRVPPQRDT